MRRLTDKLIVETVYSLQLVDGYPPTLDDIANILAIEDTKRVHRALLRALKREKLIQEGRRWISADW